MSGTTRARLELDDETVLELFEYPTRDRGGYERFHILNGFGETQGSPRSNYGAAMNDFRERVAAILSESIEKDL